MRAHTKIFRVICKMTLNSERLHLAFFCFHLRLPSTFENAVHTCIAVYCSMYILETLGKKQKNAKWSLPYAITLPNKDGSPTTGSPRARPSLGNHIRVSKHPKFTVLLSKLCALEEETQTPGGPRTRVLNSYDVSSIAPRTRRPRAALQESCK